MTIADIATIRQCVWKDMKTELLGVANADFSYPDLNGYNGPGDDLGYIANGQTYEARALNYNPTFSANGTLILRIRMFYGSQNKTFFAFNGSGFVLNLGFAGSSFVVNNTYVNGFNDVADTWRILVGTWGSAGIRTYDNGTLFGTNASTSAPNQSAFGASIAQGYYGTGSNQNYNNIAYLKMDYAAILTRQLSDAEVLDLVTTPSQLWNTGGGGGSSSKKLLKTQIGMNVGISA